MPIIKPEVQKVLRAAGLEKPLSESRTVDENLDLAGLSNEALAEHLVELALNSSSEGIKLRALETALRVKGALKEQTQELPHFTIVIQNTGQVAATGAKITESGGLNPILLPRQSLKHQAVGLANSDFASEEVSDEVEVEVELEEEVEESQEWQDQLIN